MTPQSIPDPSSRPAATAAAIWELWQSGARIETLPEELRPRDRSEAMAAQAALEAVAGPVIGWKIAATSPAGQAHIGVDGPLPGRLFERFLHHDGDTVSSAGMHMRVIEAEFAFRLGADLDLGAEQDQRRVLDAVEAVHLAIEIPDSRFEHFHVVGAEQLLADDACAGRFVLGSPVDGWADIDLATAQTSIHIGGHQVASGVGANVLDDPRSALTWLARTVAAAGTPLRAGQIVTTGTTTVPAAVAAGDRAVADFGALGSVSVTFADMS